MSKRQRVSRFVLAATLAASAGWPVSVLAQEGAPPPEGAGSAAPAEPPPPAPAPAPAAEPPAPAKPEPSIRFNFKDAPFDQVLDFFSRECELPIITEAVVPQGTMTFIGGEAYSFDEALEILNQILLMHRVNLRQEGNYLYLSDVKRAVQVGGPVFQGEVPAGVAPADIVTVTIPLSNSKAEAVAQQIKGMIADYGAVTAVPQQNVLVIVETADQARRITQVVRGIDSQGPADTQTKVFKLRHAKAGVVHAALKELVRVREKQVIIDQQKGTRQQVEDMNLEGLNFYADERTNSILAVGPESRLSMVEELIALLDTPDGADGAREMMTFALRTIAPADAAAQLSGLFAQVPADRRPVILPLPSVGKLTVVGPAPLLMQATALIGEIDPGAGRDDAGEGAGPERRATVLRLTHITPAQAEGVLGRLLTPRQQTVLRYAASPDGRGLVVSGPPTDVTAFAELVAGLDVPADVLKEVRQVRVASGEPAAVLSRAAELYKATGRGDAEPVVYSLDSQSRTATLIGGRVAVERFMDLLRTAENGVVVEQETRTFELARSRPSELAAKLARLARPMLTPADGAAYREPVLEPLDELRTLIVRAEASQFAVIEELIRRLDEERPGDQQFRVVRMTSVDPAAAIERAQALYTQQTEGLAPGEGGPVACEFDAATGNLLLTASPDAMRRFTQILDQVQQLAPPRRTTRIIDIQRVRAGEIVDPLREFLASADPIDPARKVPDPTLTVVERTNSLVVTAEEAQHRLIADYVARLDKLEPADMPPLKLLQLRTADATAVAAMLNQQYDKRPQADRVAKPVEVRADAATNTLIVSSHQDLFDEIKAFVTELNKEQGEGPERVTELFPLKVAKAEAVAAAMDKLYPQPPMPVDRLNRPMPWLQRPKEVTVSAEASSNSLIIDAPADRMDSLRELAAKLDRVELPPVAELRTYRIVAADLNAIVRTLQGLSRQGNLSGPAQPGKPQVQVVIESEPKSQTLIVAGDEVTFQRVEQVLQDLSQLPVEKGLRVVPVANAKAKEVRERALAIYEAQIAQIPGANPVEVTIDEDSNSLMVVADAEAMQRFMKVIDELQRQAGPAREVRMIELRSAKAEDVVAFLTDLAHSSESFTHRGGPEPVFEPIEATNTLLVAAQPSQMPIVEQLVKSLDNRQAAERPPLRILRLRSTDAANLASVLQASYDRRPPEQKIKLPVDIQADPATNTLIVSAHAGVLPEIEAIVTDLNETQALDAEGREIRIFPLKVARAEELARTIDAMYPEPPMPIDPRTRQPRPDLQRPREVVVRADRATNSLIVDAPAKRLAGFEQIVRQLDQQKLAENVEVRAYRVERASLESVAAALRNLAQTGAIYGTGAASGIATPVTVDTVPATRTLVVSGPSTIYPAVESVLKEMDAAPELPLTGVKMYALRSARAERIEPLLQKLLTSRVREQQLAAGKSADEAVALVEVAADPASNTVVVTAPEAVLAVADALVQTLDQQSASSAVEMRVFRLSKGDSASAATAVKASLAADQVAGEPAATVTAEPASNTIVVVGNQAQIERAGKLIEQMDVSVDPEGMGIRTIPITHGRAEAIAPVLEKVLARESALDKLPDWTRAQVISRTGELPPDKSVRVAAERALNAVVVSGPMSVLDLAEQVVRELDVDPAARAGRPERMVRVIPLANADAQELAGTIEAVFADEAAEQEPPTVRVDRASNSLIVRASAEQMATVEGLAKQVDSATVAGSRQMRMVPVDRSRADAALMAETIRRLLEQQGGVKVEVIPADQLLGAPAAEEAPKKTGDAGSTRAGDGGQAVAVKGGVSGWLATFRVAAALGVGQVGQEAAGSADEAAGVTIAVDPATNSLVVLGSPRMTDRVVALARQLEQQMPTQPTKVRIVTLPATMDAGPLAQVVMQTVRQLGRSEPSNPGGFTGPVSVAPDPSGGALIVWANDTDFASVGPLIASLTQIESATSLTVKIYPLSSVTSQRAVQAVNDLLSPAPRGRQAQRLRGDLDLALAGAEGESVRAKIDPSLVRVMSDPSGTSLIVAAPREALDLIDRFVSVIDQSPVANRLAIRRYELKNARADETVRTLQSLFDAQRQGPSAGDLPQARFVGDARTNSILVTAAEAQHADVERLMVSVDAETADEELALEIITLQNALPTVVQRIVEQVVIGRDPAKKNRVQISAQDNSSLFVVRAPREEIEEIRGIVAQVDTGETGGLPVRSVKLERADAQSVAAALQRFFVDRAAASSKPGQQTKNRVAVVGDRKSGTLVISASDEDFAQVQALAATFDAPAPSRDLQWRIVPLRNARVTDLSETIQNIAWELQWERMGGGFMWSGGRNNNADAPAEDKLFIETNERTNSVVILGQGQTLETILKIIDELDRPPSDQTRLAVKAVPVEGADLNAIAAVIREAMVTPGWQRWRGPDPDAVTVQVDQRRRLLVLLGKAPRVEQAAEYIKELGAAAGRPENRTESITLRHAQADRAANSLRRFFNERAQAAGTPADRVSIVGSADGNIVMVSAPEDELTLLRDLIAQIDQPELGKNRIEVYAVQHRKAQDIADALRANFPRTRGSDEQIIVTPQPSTNSLIVNAPEDRMAQIDALLARLDAPPTSEEAQITTVTLKTARAGDVAQALQSAMPESLKQAVKITPVSRNNTLLLTGSGEAIELVMAQISKIDVEAERPLVEFKLFKLRNATAFDVYFTLRQMLAARPRTPNEPAPTVDYSSTDNTVAVSASAEQLRDIEKMVESLDVTPEGTRTTEFIKLEFAQAQGLARALEVFYGRFAVGAKTAAARNVTVVPDPASNSLIVMAEESEWPGIRELLKKLDTEEYDTSRQLAVLPLLHADATSVARALNDGFRAPVDERFRREQARRQQTRGGRDDRDALPETPILIDAEGTPSVSPEPQTNSLVIFAGRADLERIRVIVKQLDVPDYDKFPEARVIPLSSGKATQVAGAVREMFSRQAQGRQDARRSVVIAGDDASNSLLVRAEDREFAQIKALVETMQQQGDATRATVRVLPMRSIPAARVQRTIEATFTASARQLGETLAVEVDRTSNALVIASSERLFEEIRRVAEELDAAVPAPAVGDGGPVNGLGQSVFIIDIQNNSPEEVRRMLEQMGLTRPAPADRPGVVSEPVTIVPLLTRRAIAVVAGPADGEAVSALVRAIDAAPADSQQEVAVVPLRLASAPALVQTLRAMLTPADQAAQTAPAKAVAEQVRRLNLSRSAAGKADFSLDISKPIRLVPDAQTNSVMIGSTKENVEALQEVVRTLDTLPIGDAVIVRMFPLSNASAVRAKAVVDELFRQGEALRRLPGTQRQGLPSTATGQALAGEIAVSVDDRTNMLIVAGREEAVALVEILVRDLDSDETSKWVEPTLIQLRHADATRLAATLRQALVQGLSVTPESLGLQKQIGRLRLVKSGKDAADPSARVEADLFAPLTGLIITPEPQLNALIVVGSSANIEVVKELAAMLDIEAAAASNTIRVYPLEHAAADRISAMVADIFRQREQVGATRPEDRPIITTDVRTNALIVSASPRSFELLDTLLRTLDAPGDTHTVGLHVLPVQGVDAAALAPRISRLMRERIQATQRAGGVTSPMDTFSIEADAANSLLIVAASDENFRLVQELVGTLATGSAAMSGAERTELIQLTTARAAEAADSLRELYVDKENARRGNGAVSVLPNERLNALIVAGTESDVAALRRLVEQVDRASVTSVREVKRIQLRTANAVEVVALLESVLAGRPVSGGRNGVGARQATKLRFLRDRMAAAIADATGEQPTEADIDGAVRDQVTLTPELRTNSVYVNAPPEIMALVQEIVNELDTSSAGSRKIAKFQLINADAGKMAELLGDLFNLRQQGDRFVLIPTGAAGGEADDQPGMNGTTLTAVPDQRQELAITVDARTNTLLVSGTEEYLTLVREVVEELDAIEANERTRRVISLQNAAAPEVEATLSKYFRDEADRLRQTLGPDNQGSVLGRLEQEVTIVGDEKSNKIVISASPRYIDTVERIVSELDAAPPQVMIEVLLAEVTLDRSDTWGMDIKVGPIGGDVYNFGSFATGAGVTTGVGVPNFAVSSADFSLLIRALEAQGKLEVLSRPKVQVKNNEIAVIQVGEDVPIVNGVERFDLGNTLANVERRPVGIILDVRPTISPNGFVTMSVRPEISSVSARSVQISPDFTAPIIDQRSVETVVSVKDGQTVVIGGLIQTRAEERKSKVPFLGDIPVLGAPFRTSQVNDVKTELLVVLTPRVIPGDSRSDLAKLDAITNDEIDGMSNADRLYEILDSHRAGGPDLANDTPDGLSAASTPAPAPAHAPSPRGPYVPGMEPPAMGFQGQEPRP